MRARIGRPSPAMVVAIVALVAALSGTTWAAVKVTVPAGAGGGVSAGSSSANAGASLAPAQRRAARRKAARRRNRKVIPSRNTVGVRQLRRNAVVTGKIRNNAVNGAKIRDKSLSGADINLNLLGKVPNAENADSAGDAGSVDGHNAGCPGGATLIRGVCFDAQSNGVAGSLNAASDACASKGGWLPTPLQLRSVRSIINLGDGTGTDKQLTDSIYADDAGGSYRTITVDGAGNMQFHQIDQPAEYICVYPLVR